MSNFLSHLPDLNLPARAMARIRKGQGRLSVLRDALTEAGYELRPIPEALAGRYGQREAARKVPLSRNTLAALAQGRGTIQSYVTLAAAFKVTPKIAERKSYAACHSSKSQTWQTPAPLLAAILQAAGRSEFDLDPCSPLSDGPVPATVHRTEADDGLVQPWRGLVFVNPPYSRSLPKWVAKCASEAASGAVVVGLVPSRTDTRWWHSHVAGRAAVIALKGRLRFGDGAGSAPFPSAVVVWGDSRLAERIARAFPGSWHVPATVAAA